MYVSIRSNARLAWRLDFFWHVCRAATGLCRDDDVGAIFYRYCAFKYWGEYIFKPLFYADNKAKNKDTPLILLKIGCFTRVLAVKLNAGVAQHLRQCNQW